MGLEPDLSKKVYISVPGGAVDEYNPVKIKLFIRKRTFTVDALFGAVAGVTDLLVGMDVIKQLNSEDFSLGI